MLIDPWMSFHVSKPMTKHILIPLVEKKKKNGRERERKNELLKNASGILRDVAFLQYE